MRHLKPYTPEDDARITALYMAGEQLHVIADAVGRTRYSVESRVHKLNIRRNRIKIEAGRTGCRWTREEIETLRANSAKPIDVIMSLVPGRTKGAIYAQLQELGGDVEREYSRPLNTPFVTASGVKAIRLATGTVPYVPSIHDELVGA
jgi:hypothetical protein